MIDFYNLTTAVSIHKVTYYLPTDPFGVYRKLLEIFINARNVKQNAAQGATLKSTNEKYNIIKSLDWVDYESRRRSKDNLTYLLWVHQSIPVKFWLYKNFITINQDKLKESAKNADEYQMWVDTPGIKNKIKLSRIEKNLIDSLKSKILSIPDYDSICEQVYNWGHSTIYKYGKVEETSINLA